MAEKMTKRDKFLEVIAKLEQVSDLKEQNNDLRKFIKDTRLFEYNITRKDNKYLTYQNVKYLIDILSPILVNATSLEVSVEMVNNLFSPFNL